MQVFSCEFEKYFTGTMDNVLNLLKVNNKDTITASMMSLWCRYCELWIDFKHCSDVSILTINKWMPFEFVPMSLLFTLKSQFSILLFFSWKARFIQITVILTKIFIQNSKKVLQMCPFGYIYAVNQVMKLVKHNKLTQKFPVMKRQV